MEPCGDTANHCVQIPVSKSYALTTRDNSRYLRREGCSVVQKIRYRVIYQGKRRTYRITLHVTLTRTECHAVLFVSSFRGCRKPAIFNQRANGGNIVIERAVAGN